MLLNIFGAIFIAAGFIAGLHYIARGYLERKDAGSRISKIIVANRSTLFGSGILAGWAVLELLPLILFGPAILPLYGICLLALVALAVVTYLIRLSGQNSRLIQEESERKRREQIESLERELDL